jgi:integrative and conjugative element protein (TIGR02256 family)
MGRFINNSEDIVVDKITLPMPGDKATRFSFFRNRNSHQKIIDREWEASCFTCTYLGEWHTHPEPIPTPSFVDKNDWKRKMKQDVFDSDFLFFMIVGTAEIWLWEGNKHKNSITALNKV